MLGVSFDNPNTIFSRTEASYQYVENVLECFTTLTHEQLIIYYDGYPNEYVHLKALKKDLSIEVFLSVSALMQGYSHRYSEFSTADFSFFAQGKNVTLILSSNSQKITFVFSKERFLYLLDRCILGYTQYLLSKMYLGRLFSETEKNYLDELHIKQYYYFGHLACKFGKDKQFFRADELIAYTDAFNIGKVRLLISGVSYYLSVSEMNVIANDILSERIFKLAARTGNNTILVQFIRKTETILRLFELRVGNESTMDIIVTCGNGRFTSNGPYISKVLQQVKCTLSFDELINFAKDYQIALKGYLICEYLRDHNRPPNRQKISQITKVHTTRSLIAPVARAFNMRKIRIDFASYTKQFEQDKYIHIYLSEEEFNTLYYSFMLGNLKKLIQQESIRTAQANAKYSKPVYSITCGTKLTEDTATTKVLNIVPSKDSDYLLIALQGTGIIKDNLYHMKTIQDRVYIPISTNDLKGLFITTKVYWEAYKIAQTIFQTKKEGLRR